MCFSNVFQERKMREAEAGILEGELIRKKAAEDAEAERIFSFLSN